jgi:O-acetylserine/cysteine efflux transporter
VTRGALKKLPAPASLPWRHFVLALAVVAVWGTNFAIIKVALGSLPPLLFAALGFALALVLAMFFLPRPSVPWRNVALYGLLIGVGQFGLLYLAINGHISPGIESLVLQIQVFFTIGLSMRLSQERVRPFQWFALLLATAGIAVIVLHTDGSTTLLGLALVLLAAMAQVAGSGWQPNMNRPGQADVYCGNEQQSPPSGRRPCPPCHRCHVRARLAARVLQGG